jgi:hypothetical protein
MAEQLVGAWVLLPTGVAVGLVGSLIGAGGGFFVVPFLILHYGFTKEHATAVSLAIVLLNAASASVANARRRRIDYRTAAALAAGTLPGAWIGRELVARLSPRAFSLSFAALLTAVAVYLVVVRLREGGGILPGKPREHADAEGRVHRYRVNLPIGAAVSLVVGLVSSLFGVGGGLLLVPFMVAGFGMPTILAAASAQFVFLFTASAGVAASAAGGHMSSAGVLVLVLMGAGVVLGAQAGVRAARRVRDRIVRWALAAVLLAVAAGMFLDR